MKIISKKYSDWFEVLIFDMIEKTRSHYKNRALRKKQKIHDDVKWEKFNSYWNIYKVILGISYTMSNLSS